MEPFQRPQPSAVTYTRSLNGRPATSARPVVSNVPIRGRSIDGVNRPIVSRRLPTTPAPQQPVEQVVSSPIVPIQQIPTPLAQTIVSTPPAVAGIDTSELSIDALLSQPPLGNEAPVAPVPSPEVASVQTVQAPAAPVAAKPARVGVRGRLAKFRTLPRRGLALLIAVGVLVALGGGTAAAYYGSVVPNRSDNVLAQALMNTIANKAETQSVTGEVASPNYQFLLSGNSAKTGAYQFKADATINGTKGTFEVLSNDGQKMYVRGTGVSGLAVGTQANEQAALIQSMLKLYTPLLKKIDGQWYQFNAPIKPLTEADQTTIAKLYAKEPILSIKEVVQDEKIGSDDSYHYKVVINGDNLRSFLINMKDAGVGGYELTQDKLSLINDTIQKTDFSQRPIDIWIRKDGKLINQVAVNTNGISVKMTYGNFGKPVSVSAPNGYRGSNDVYEELQSIRSSDALYNSGLMDGDNSAIGVLLMTAMH